MSVTCELDALITMVGATAIAQRVSAQVKDWQKCKTSTPEQTWCQAALDSSPSGLRGMVL